MGKPLRFERDLHRTQRNTGHRCVCCSVQIGCVCNLEPLLLPVGCSLNCGHEVSFSVSALRAGKSSYRAVDESQRCLLRSAGTLAKSIRLHYKGSPVAFAQTGLSTV